MKRIIIFSALVHAATSMENGEDFFSKLPRDLFNYTCSFLDHKSVDALATTSKTNAGRIKAHKKLVIQKLKNDINDVNVQNIMKKKGAYTLIHWEALLTEEISLFDRYKATKEDKTHILIGLLQLCWETKQTKLTFSLEKKLEEEEYKTSISNTLKEYFKKLFYPMRKEKGIDEYLNALMFALPFSTAVSAINEEVISFYNKYSGDGHMPIGYIKTPKKFMEKLCDFHIKKKHYLSPESFFKIFDTEKKRNDYYNIYLCSFKSKAFDHMIRFNSLSNLLPFYFNYSSELSAVFIKKAVFLWKENEFKKIEKEDMVLIKEMAFASLWVCTKSLALAERLIDKVKNLLPYIQWTQQDNKILLLTILNRRFYSAIKKKSIYSNEEREKIREYEVVNASIVKAILQSDLQDIEQLVKSILDYSHDHVNFQLLKVLLEKITNIEFFAETLKYNRINQSKDFSAYILECIKKQLLQKDVLYLNGILESEWAQDNHQLRELILSCIETLSK